MQPRTSTAIVRRLKLLPLFAALTMAFSPATVSADEFPSVLDDFTDSARSSSGIDRVVVTDSSAGGSSQLRQKFANGVLSAEGEIAPARGQPGWVSLVLLLSPNGQPTDLSKYEGIKVRVRVRKGMLSLTANSSEITNFDFHSSLLSSKGTEFQEVRVPFRDMKRAWSEQIPLNRATITSVSLVAVDLQKGSFAYDIDEIGFY
jgi:hypothetical protein